MGSDGRKAHHTRKYTRHVRSAIPRDLNSHTSARRMSRGEFLGELSEGCVSDEGLSAGSEEVGEWSDSEEVEGGSAEEEASVVSSSDVIAEVSSAEK